MGNDAYRMGTDADAATEKMFKRRRLIRTACTVFLYISLGLCHGIIGLTLLDLAELYHTSIATITSVFTTKAVGMVCGSFIGGAVVDHMRMRSDAVMAAVTLLLAVSITMTPWASFVGVLGGCFFIQGVMHGTTNVVCSTLLLSEWAERSPVPLNLMHSGFGVGLLTAPPLVLKFLSRPLDQHNATIYPVNATLQSLNKDVVMTDIPNVMPDVLMGKSYIYIPYGIIGLFVFIFFFTFLYFYLQHWTYKPQTSITKRRGSVDDLALEQKTNTTRVRRMQVFMAISLFFMYIFIDMRENSLILFGFTVGVKGFGFSKVTADLYSFVFMLSYVVGRLVSVILTKFINIKIFVPMFTVISLLFAILLQTLGFVQPLNLWVLTVLQAATMSPAYACFMAWADRYIEVNGMVVCVLDLGIGLGEFVSAYLGGYLIDRWGARTVFSMLLAASVGATIMWLLMQVVCSRYGDRYDTDKQWNGSQLANNTEKEGASGKCVSSSIATWLDDLSDEDSEGDWDYINLDQLDKMATMPLIGKN